MTDHKRQTIIKNESGNHCLERVRIPKKTQKTEMTQGERQRTTWNDHERNQNNKEHRGTKTSTNDKQKETNTKNIKREPSLKPLSCLPNTWAAGCGSFIQRLCSWPLPLRFFLVQTQGYGASKQRGMKTLASFTSRNSPQQVRLVF